MELNNFIVGGVIGVIVLVVLAYIRTQRGGK